MKFFGSFLEVIEKYISNEYGALDNIKIGMAGYTDKNKLGFGPVPDNCDPYGARWFKKWTEVPPALQAFVDGESKRRVSSAYAPNYKYGMIDGSNWW